jgi:hypothetical protein
MINFNIYTQEFMVHDKRQALLREADNARLIASAPRRSKHSVLRAIQNRMKARQWFPFSGGEKSAAPCAQPTSGSRKRISRPGRYLPCP